MSPTLDRLKADLDALRPLAPEQAQRVLQKFRLEWNYHSNAIEGNSLTLGETRSLLLHGLTAAGKPMRDHLDIKGHNEAVLWLEEIVRDERPLTEQFIRGMHQVLLGEPYETPAQTPDGQPTRRTIQPGQYKTGPNNVLTATGEMFYFATPEETSSQMTDLVDWYRQQADHPTLHPVALAAEFHYRFVRIHPFDDGNGRMSRLLMNLILMRHGYPMTVIKTEDRNRYLAALADADAGEFEPFLGFIAENVESSLRLMIRAAKGESVDEPDDLDKKLALLRVQILNSELPPSAIWSLEVQKRFYSSLAQFWLKDLAGQVDRFNDFFTTKRVTFAFYSPLDSGSNQVKTLEEAQRFAENSLIFSVEKFDTMLFNFAWNSFKKPNSEFNIRLVVEFVFSEFLFTVNYIIHDGKLEDEDLIWNVVFQSHYELDYNHNQIHEINWQLANKVYDFIAAKVAEADTPRP